MNTDLNPQSSDFGICFSSHRLLDFPLFVAIAATFSLLFICLLSSCFRSISFILIHCKEFKVVFFIFIYLVTNFSRQWKVSTHDIVYLPFIFLFRCFRFFSMVFFVFGVDVNLLPFQVELKSKCSFLFHTNIINRKKYNFVTKIVLCWGSQWRTDGLFSELKVVFKANA